MEVEVKIRLPDRAAYEKVAEILAPGKQATHDQENYFFDGKKQELESKRSVMRLRFYNVDRKAVITVKGKQILEDGIGRASEVEENADPVVARGWLQDPQAMLEASPLLSGMNKKIGIENLRCMGGFKNHRTEYAWEGHVVELDETQYDWGKLYEIECESDCPEELRAKLEAMLKSNGITFKYSPTTKFANFINRTLD